MAWRLHNYIHFGLVDLTEINKNLASNDEALIEKAKIDLISQNYNYIWYYDGWSPRDNWIWDVFKTLTVGKTITVKNLIKFKNEIVNHDNYKMLIDSDYVKNELDELFDAIKFIENSKNVNGNNLITLEFED